MEQKDAQREAPAAQAAHAPLSVDNARLTIQRAWSFGHVLITGHFRKRGSERSYTMVDVGHVVRAGTMCGGPTYCPDFRNWKYSVSGQVGDETLEVLFALDPAEDMFDCPLVILITAYWK